MTSNSDAPEVSETSVLLGLSHSFKIFSHDGIKLICNELSVGTVSWVLSSVQEPGWDVVFNWSRDDIVDLVDFSVGDFSTSNSAVDLSGFEGEDGESSTETSDLSETEWGLLFTVNICVLHSKNVSKLVSVLQSQGSHVSLQELDLY